MVFEASSGENQDIVGIYDYEISNCEVSKYILHGPVVDIWDALKAEWAEDEGVVREEWWDEVK